MTCLLIPTPLPTPTAPHSSQHGVFLFFYVTSLPFIYILQGHSWPGLWSQEERFGSIKAKASGTPDVLMLPLSI